MKYNLMSRRMFLQGVGRTLPMPFLASLLPKELWAQATGSPVKRYIAIASNYDYGHHQNWFPSLAQPGLSMNPASGDNRLYYAPLSSYLTSSTANLSRIFGNHLNGHINSVNLIRGLDLSTRLAHGRGYFFGNFAANDGHEANSTSMTQLRTIDQVLRDNTRFNGINRDVTVMGNDSRSYRRNSNGTIGLASLVADSPTELYNYLFDRGNYPESGGSGGGTVRHARYDLLSGVMDDYRRVRGGTQISAADRVALDNALDLLADVQRGLAGTTTPVTGACSYRSIPRTGNGSSFFTNNVTLKAYADLIAASIMCDTSRIFSMSVRLDEYAYDVNPSEDFHQGHSHIPFTLVNGKVNHQYMGEIQNHFVRNFIAPLISNLAGAIDPSNSHSYLYNSLVHYALECSQVHSLNSQPCMLAGNAGGALTSGYYLDYTDRSRIHQWSADSFSSSSGDARFGNDYAGVPVNRLFNTILQSMGLTPAEYENSSLNTHFQGRSDNRYGAINNGIASMGGYGHWGPSSSSYGADYDRRQPLFNLHHFKNVLQFPNSSAA